MKWTAMLIGLMLLTGCTYINFSLNGTEPACLPSNVTVNIFANRDVPFDILRNPTLQGNVPLQGGTVKNPTQTVTQE